MAPLVEIEILTEPAWRARRAAHESRVDEWITPVLQRAARGERHPVEDFLFTYYTFRPRQLRRWSPGIGVVLTGASADELAQLPDFAATDGGVLLPPPPARVRQSARWISQLLERTAARPAQFGCFGLHEWAMVHHQAHDEIRHHDWPLRLGAARTDEVVESLPVRCSHSDAYRFFAPSARELNTLRPARETQHDLEQSGCLHANMDLYKWSYKLFPWVPAELVADCFDLARRVRALDMRASPYDFTALGYPPVPIETPSGRREYVEAQRAFAAEAAPLREALTAAALRVAIGDQRPATAQPRDSSSRQRPVPSR